MEDITSRICSSSCWLDWLASINNPKEKIALNKSFWLATHEDHHDPLHLPRNWAFSYSRRTISKAPSCMKIKSSISADNKPDFISQSGEILLSWLVGWVLCHINLSRLFNVKSIFKQIVSFRLFSLAWVHSLIVKNISISSYSVYSIQFSISTDFVYTQLNVKTILYWTNQFRVSKVSMSETVPLQNIQFSISTQFKCKYSLIVKSISISSYSV